MDFQIFKKRNRQLSEFKPDANPSTFIKTARLTRQQKLQIGKWFLYIMVCLLCLILQDVLMSTLRLFGTTTDLPVCAIMLIAMLEGTETGSLFLLISSTVYYFTGSSPGAYCIALLTFIGTGVGLMRQMYLHRNKSTIIACSAIAILLYEVGTFVVGLLSGLTIWNRFFIFVLTALYSSLALIPLHSLIYKIGTIGGSTWKE